MSFANQSTSVLDVSAKAENDLSTKIHYCLEISGEDQVDVIDDAAKIVIGVLMNKPRANEAANMRVLGIAPIVSDGSGTPIAPGNKVKVTNAGKVVKATADAENVVGISFGSSSADGTVIPVLLTPGNQRAS